MFVGFAITQSNYPHTQSYYTRARAACAPHTKDSRGVSGMQTVADDGDGVQERVIMPRARPLLRKSSSGSSHGGSGSRLVPSDELLDAIDRDEQSAVADCVEATEPVLSTITHAAPATSSENVRISRRKVSLGILQRRWKARDSEERHTARTRSRPRRAADRPDDEGHCSLVDPAAACAMCIICTLMTLWILFVTLALVGFVCWFRGDAIGVSNITATVRWVMGEATPSHSGQLADEL